ncbi:hypothetical protein F5884DRAFT_1933 [Xylogone sp. PMI_703]|nr:hypothetical protein F5884DRAFT_1933 [Xylogone sp. PMI_703]
MATRPDHINNGVATEPGNSRSVEAAVQDQPTTEPFPSLEDPPSPSSPGGGNTGRSRAQSSASTLQGRLRSASKKFEESSIPTGMWVATGQIVSTAPTILDIRSGAYSTEGWSGEGQLKERTRRASITARGDIARKSAARQSLRRQTWALDEQRGALPEAPGEAEQQSPGAPISPMADRHRENANVGKAPEDNEDKKRDASGLEEVKRSSSSETNLDAVTSKPSQYRTTPFDNGYQFPPKHTWKQSTAIFLKAFWKFFTTPLGFVVTIYGLNVVAWGGMLFLLLCNAAPAMCHPTCNDINSPRRIWIEIDSQILNALFCVTGFGTIPWRFRDLYYLLQYRIQKKELGLRRLAGINRGWFRLQGSQELPAKLGPANIENEVSNVPEHVIPFPPSKIPDAPLTGFRASPTALWKLDFVIWAMVWNTFLQAVLCGFMWHFNRHTRPSWSTGLFVALACVVAGLGGIMSFVEGKRVKGIEGVPVSDEDRARLERDMELGIVHYNNIKDEAPKEKKNKKAKKDNGSFT